MIHEKKASHKALFFENKTDNGVTKNNEVIGQCMRSSFLINWTVTHVTQPEK